MRQGYPGCVLGCFLGSSLSFFSLFDPYFSRVNPSRASPNRSCRRSEDTGGGARMRQGYPGCVLCCFLGFILSFF